MPENELLTGKILSPADVSAWRQSLGAAARPAVVTGTFDILQPGNLAVLRRADEISGAVMVILEGDALVATHTTGGRPRHGVDVRSEFVAHLRQVRAVTHVTDVRDAERVLDALGPFTLVTAAGRDQSDPLTPVALRRADKLESVATWPGCDTEAVERAVRMGSTPVGLPSGYEGQPDTPFPARGCRVTVNGCFDVLHLGHLRFLNAAAAMGDELVLLINSDASIRRYKGESRPVFPQAFRCAALRAVDGVRSVAVFEGDDPLDELERWKPAIHVKGGSYEPGRVRAERELVAAWGGRVAGCPLTEGFSTTGYVQEVRSNS